MEKKVREVSLRLQISWLNKTFNTILKTRRVASLLGCLGRDGGEGQKTYFHREHHFKTQRTLKHTHKKPEGQSLTKSTVL